MHKYLNKLFKVSSERNFWLTILGKTGRQQIWALRTKLEFSFDLPQVLIAAGFHGEEVAGPFSVLKFLEEADDLELAEVNFTFLPCVNPIGFNRNTRYARSGEKTNAGFCHHKNGDILSVEGQILMENIDFIKEMSKDGFLSLHEDVDSEKFYTYIYSFPKVKRALSFAEAIRNEEANYFETIENGTKMNEGNDPEAIAVNGIIQNHCDGSFEDFLAHEGIIRTVATETPGKGIALEKRVEVCTVLIRKFVELTKMYRISRRA
ncbi:hypothetical protein A2Z67_02850 [Candidatus Woesebacteria bacterium RBG_13_36_22]|uniref:Succinylglutamate desuccinylase/Aspartoacylase catalytic domain-containing protein n=1 Tax=Candidatus Woesebacteria bacterium RBG_13_36_22 TaxID=1802478 RepID=A0A1F7X5Z9_9BACT|nr:MAG: hypothetical protein A2Z67_02850 [Candidatus Woesebacteria bacterium RBG_13_36_22]